MPDSSSKEPDLYELLSVSPSASTAEIRAAYLSLIRQEHPDRALSRMEAEERAAALNEAYAVLGDPLKRAAYDESRRKSAAQRTARSAVATTYAIWEVDERDGQFSALCRCGNMLSFSLQQVTAADEAGQKEIILECEGCSERTKIIDFD